MVLPAISTEPVNRLHDPFPVTLELLGKSIEARERAITGLPSISSRLHSVPASPRSMSAPDGAAAGAAAAWPGFLSAMHPLHTVSATTARQDSFTLFFIAIPYLVLRPRLYPLLPRHPMQA